MTLIHSKPLILIWGLIKLYYSEHHSKLTSYMHALYSNLNFLPN